VPDGHQSSRTASTSAHRSPRNAVSDVRRTVRRRRTRAARNVNVSMDRLVFQSPEGLPIRATPFRRRFWTPAVDAAELAPLRIHDLRHTVCRCKNRGAAGLLVEVEFNDDVDKVPRDGGSDLWCRTVVAFDASCPCGQAGYCHRQDSGAGCVAGKPQVSSDRWLAPRSATIWGSRTVSWCRFGSAVGGVV
jgi:hypothetical protein